MPYPTYIFSYAIVITSLTVTCSVLRLITRLICASRNAVKFSSPAGLTGRGRCHRVFHRVGWLNVITRFHDFWQLLWKYIRGRETFCNSRSTTVGRFIFDLRHWKAVVEREESGIEGLSRTGSQSFSVFTVNAGFRYGFHDFLWFPSNRIGIGENGSRSWPSFCCELIIRGLLDSFSFSPFWGEGRIDDCNCTIFHFWYYLWWLFSMSFNSGKMKKRKESRDRN